MERRSDARKRVEIPAKLTVLGDLTYAIEAVVENRSGNGMRLRLGHGVAREIAVDTAVRVDFEDSLALGEVCYCQSTGDGYALGVQIEQTLSHLSGVEALMRRFGADDSLPRAPA
ncbi:MAG: PilZ domain-containing protein [Bryobacteraceae bacterium]